MLAVVLALCLVQYPVVMVVVVLWRPRLRRGEEVCLQSWDPHSSGALRHVPAKSAYSDSCP